MSGNHLENTQTYQNIKNQRLILS